jgi:hypothetical protein
MRNAHPTVVPGLGRDADAAAGGRVRDGIADQVGKDRTAACRHRLERSPSCAPGGAAGVGWSSAAALVPFTYSRDGSVISTSVPIDLALWTSRVRAPVQLYQRLGNRQTKTSTFLPASEAPTRGNAAARNMELPYGLPTFEELIEVLIKNPQARKLGIEIQQQLIRSPSVATGAVVARRRASCRSAADARYTVAREQARCLALSSAENPAGIDHARSAMPSCSDRGRFVRACRRSLGARTRQRQAHHHPRAHGARQRNANVVVSVLRRMTIDFALERASAARHAGVRASPSHFRPIRASSLSPASGQLPRLPGKGANAGSRSLLSRSGPRRSIPPSYRVQHRVCPAHVQ